jgi:hypothetical protein
LPPLHPFPQQSYASNHHVSRQEVAPRCDDEEQRDGERDTNDPFRQTRVLLDEPGRVSDDHECVDGAESDVDSGQDGHDKLLVPGEVRLVLGKVPEFETDLCMI